MKKYILRFTGNGAKPAADVARIRKSQGVTIVDEAPRMLLVQCPKTRAKQLVEALDNWVMSEERTIELPNPRPKVRSKRAA
ncbi:MAG: hypothetical protein LJE97_11000 [Betaproteobacteria bacterium]|nr:hypothetical protein [Betaproteobacteria bacterium]